MILWISPIKNGTFLNLLLNYFIFIEYILIKIFVKNETTKFLNIQWDTLLHRQWEPAVLKWATKLSLNLGVSFEGIKKWCLVYVKKSRFGLNASSYTFMFGFEVIFISKTASKVEHFTFSCSFIIVVSFRI